MLLNIFDLSNSLAELQSTNPHSKQIYSSKQGSDHDCRLKLEPIGLGSPNYVNHLSNGGYSIPFGHIEARCW